MSCRGPASTKAVPSVGCPAKSISLTGVKILIFAWPPASAGSTNVTSEKLISRASACIVSPSSPRASVKTASWFPSSGLSVKTTDGDEISLTFDQGELERLLDEDVEAHGMRETLAVLTVAAGMAAAGAGSALASPVTDGALPGGAATPAAQVTASEVSTGLGTQQTAATARSATASEISTGVVAATPATPSEVSTGITAKPTATPVSADDPSWSPGTTAGVALAGTILALTAVGFAMRSRRGPRVAT